ncbi:hypothetical protein R6Q59_002997, partial [Mikania micrantha]
MSGYSFDPRTYAINPTTKEFGAPTYTYFTSGATTLGLMLYLQARLDHEGYAIIGLNIQNQSCVLQALSTQFLLRCYQNHYSIRKVVRKSFSNSWEGFVSQR